MVTKAEIINKVNSTFDYQLRNSKKCEVDKRLFNLTLGFTLDDWGRIYTEKYFQTIDAIENQVEKKNFTLKCVKYYNKHLRNQSL